MCYVLTKTETVKIQGNAKIYFLKFKTKQHRRKEMLSSIHLNVKLKGFVHRLKALRKIVHAVKIQDHMQQNTTQ